LYYPYRRKLCQPLGIVTKNYSQQDLIYRPLFSLELQHLVDKMSTPPEFWDYCYSQQLYNEFLSDPNKMKTVSKICQILRDKDLVDEHNNGAVLPLALIKLDLVETFLALVN